MLGGGIPEGLNILMDMGGDEGTVLTAVLVPHFRLLRCRLLIPLALAQSILVLFQNALP